MDDQLGRYTNGQSFQTTQSYSGEQNSAEWINEAPTTPSGIAQVTSFWPQVSFSGLGFGSNSTPSEFDAITLDQNGRAVSSPGIAYTLGQLLSGGFGIMYDY